MYAYVTKVYAYSYSKCWKYTAAGSRYTYRIFLSTYKYFMGRYELIIWSMDRFTYDRTCGIDRSYLYDEWYIYCNCKYGKYILSKL